MTTLTTTAPNWLAYAEMERLATAIAKSGLFGIRTPEQAMVLMQISQAEGRHPALAARDYDIIQGRPAKKAEAMHRDFLAGGGTVKWTTLTDDTADATFSHPQGGTARIVWDTDRAALAGLEKKENWRKYPRQMLRNRVVSEGVRTVWPMATSGFHLPEELGDATDRPSDDAAFAGTTLEHEPEPAPPPKATGPKPPHSIAPPRGAPDADWRACLDRIAPALHQLRTRELVEKLADGPTCSDIIANGPHWAQAELGTLLADNIKRFVEAEPEPADDLPDVEIIGQEKVSAG